MGPREMTGKMMQEKVQEVEANVRYALAEKFEAAPATWQSWKIERGK